MTMMTDLVPFLSLRADHTYFRNRKDMNLGFVPVGLAGFLHGKSLVYIAERRNGFELFIDRNRLGIISEYLRDAENDYLYFIMTLNNPGFLNFTEIDIPKGMFLHLRNHDPKAGESFRLHQDDFVSEKDLADAGSEAASNIPREFFLKPKSFALVEVPFGKRIADAATADSNTKLPGTSGMIHFKARSTVWKYTFIATNEPPFDSLHVIDSKGLVSFSKMLVEEIPEGSKVYVTKSDVSIPLQEMPDYLFQLKGMQNGSEHTIIQRLAGPNPDYLSRVDGKIVSTIFIYY